MNKIIAILLAGSLLACEDKFYKDKYDVEFFITNKSTHIVPQLKIDGGNGSKIWTFKNLTPESTEKLRLNIKRELRIPEGGFIFSTVAMKGDSLSLNTGYFTNWNYVLPNPTIIHIFDDRIELQK